VVGRAARLGGLRGSLPLNGALASSAARFSGAGVQPDEWPKHEAFYVGTDGDPQTCWEHSFSIGIARTPISAGPADRIGVPSTAIAS